MGLISWWRHRRHPDPSPEPSIGPEPFPEPSAGPDPEPVPVPSVGPEPIPVPSVTPEPVPEPSVEPEPRHRFGWRIRKLIELLAQLKSIAGSGTLVIVVVAILVALVWYFSK